MTSPTTQSKSAREPQFTGDPELLTLITYRIDLKGATPSQWFPVAALPTGEAVLQAHIRRIESMQEELRINWPRSFVRRDLPFEEYEPSTRIVHADEVGYTFLRKSLEPSRLPHDVYFRTGLIKDPAQDRVVYSKCATLKVPVTEICRCEIEVYGDALSGMRKPLHVVTWPASALSLKPYCVTSTDLHKLDALVRDWDETTFGWIKKNDQIDQP